MWMTICSIQRSQWLKVVNQKYILIVKRGNVIVIAGY